MSFDLNKNAGSDQTDPANQSKFDLSKNDASNIDEPSKKPKNWIMILLTLIILGGGAWYFISRSTNKQVTAIDSASVATIKPDHDNVTADTTKTSNSSATDSADSKVNAGSLPPKSTPSKDSVPRSSVTPPTTANRAQNGKPIFNQVAASFNRGSASFSKITRSVVNGLVKLSKTASTDRIIVNGYASSEGGLAVNQRISQNRADAFKKYLVSKGADESKITTVGRGIENPIASNDTETGRQKNRRVEVVTQ
ncbi:MAG TPA: OmpA family protein [Mucilaginibacter sp.]|nr:OmpA family protein [Mucilaginibacter sp.]